MPGMSNSFRDFLIPAHPVHRREIGGVWVERRFFSASGRGNSTCTFLHISEEPTAQ